MSLQEMVFRNLVGGVLTDAVSSMNVINPANGEVFATCPETTHRELDDAVAQAKRAFATWRLVSVGDRATMLARAAEVIRLNTSVLGRILTAEQGKPLREAEGEVAAAAAMFEKFAAVPLTPEREFVGDREVALVRRPLGVVGAIVPWNFPVLLMAMKIPAALMAGNVVVLKPAPSTPLATLKIGELLADVFPPGVLNVISGAAELGAWLTAHPDVDKISFTGSTEVGIKVIRGAADGLKRLTLELGGNDAAIVLPDVDVAKTADAIFKKAFRNTGQVCTAIKRLYVHDTVYDEMCGELARLADKSIVGNGMDEATEIGPLQNRAQYDKVRSIIDDARSHGVVIAGDQEVDSAGYFIRPTIVRDISDGAMLVDEEQFGPVLPVVSYTDIDEVIDRANASPYGLGGSIWGGDLERANALALRIDAGTVWVNDHGTLNFALPFGGAKRSGIGSELGPHSLHEFTQLHVVNLVH